MKIEVCLIVYDSDNCPTRGRTCWINKNGNDELMFGSIYLTKETAPVLTSEQVEFVKSKANQGGFIIEKLHED